MDENQTINIKDYEYARFVRLEDRYSVLVDALFRSARLGYDGESLSFDSGVVDLLMKTFETGAYEKLLKQLKEEKEVAFKQLLTEKEKNDEQRS